MATRLQVTQLRDTNNRTSNRLTPLKDTLHPMLNRHLDSKAVALPLWKDGMPFSLSLPPPHAHASLLYTCFDARTWSIYQNSDIFLFLSCNISAWLRFVVAAYWMLAFKTNKLDPLISCFAFGGKLVFMKK